MTDKPQFVGEKVTFADAFSEVSRGVRKFKQKEYFSCGAHPIIDQGQEKIAGYSDEEDGLFSDVPAVVFGDHTRCLKYVEEPFFAGADGVKILKPKLSDNTRFWWHAIKATPLGDLGYSRHFKLLKAATFRVYGKDQQSEITKTLDSVLAQIAFAENQIEYLDQLVKSRFVEMFEVQGHPLVPLSELSISMRNGLSPSKTGLHRAKVLTLSAITQGSFDSGSWKEGLFAEEPPLDKRIAAGEFYVCRGNGNKQLVGTGEYSPITDGALVFPDTMIAVKVKQDRVALPFLKCAWKQPTTRKQIETSAKTTNGTFKINQTALGNVRIPLPPLSFQQEFAGFAASVDKSRFIEMRDMLKVLYAQLVSGLI